MTTEILTRAKLTGIIAEKHGLTQKAAKAIVNDTLDVIYETMNSGVPVRFVGFGSFVQVETKERIGRNPNTGKKIKIPASKRIRFRASKA